MFNPQSGPPNDNPDAPQPVTLPQLLEMVEKACRGDQALSQQLFSAFMQMRLRPDTPTNERALADVLIQILIGDRKPVLEGLEAEDIQPIKGLLQRLGTNGS